MTSFRNSSVNQICKSPWSWSRIRSIDDVWARDPQTELRNRVGDKNFSTLSKPGRPGLKLSNWTKTSKNRYESAGKPGPARKVGPNSDRKKWNSGGYVDSWYGPYPSLFSKKKIDLEWSGYRSAICRLGMILIYLKLISRFSVWRFLEKSPCQSNQMFSRIKDENKI